MRQKLDVFYDNIWRVINEERNVRIESFIDTLSMADREVVKLVWGIREYEFMKRPTVSKASKILGIPLRTLHRRLKQIVKSVPHPSKNLFA